MPPGRRPLPEGLARTERFTTKLRPAGAQEFRAAAQARGLTEADALREAMADWTRKHSATTTTRSTR